MSNSMAMISDRNLQYEHSEGGVEFSVPDTAYVCVTRRVYTNGSNVCMSTLKTETGRVSEISVSNSVIAFLTCKDCIELLSCFRGSLPSCEFLIRKSSREKLDCSWYKIDITST